MILLLFGLSCLTAALTVCVIILAVRIDSLRVETADFRESVTRQLHTRQNRAVMPTGATTPEREAVRLGQSSAGRRTVVGGEPDSDLFRSLDKTPRPEEGIDG